MMNAAAASEKWKRVWFILRMPPHSAPSAAGGDVMDICEATYEVTGDQRGALITTQQVRVTSGRPRVSTVSG